MALRILAFTRATTFQERKLEYLRRGFRIDDECPTPVNGLCSFVVVKDDPTPDPFEHLDILRSRVIESD